MYTGFSRLGAKVNENFCYAKVSRLKFQVRKRFVGFSF